MLTILIIGFTSIHNIVHMRLFPPYPQHYYGIILKQTCPNKEKRIDYYHSLCVIFSSDHRVSNPRFNLLLKFQTFRQLINPEIVVQTPSDLLPKNLLLSIVKATSAHSPQMNRRFHSRTTSIHFCSQSTNQQSHINGSKSNRFIQISIKYV